MEKSGFFGRLVPTNRLSKTEIAEFAETVSRYPVFDGKKCRRCCTVHQIGWRLPSGVRYCGACIGLGRISDNEELWTIPEPNDFDIVPEPLTWEGNLTTQQRVVVNEVKGHTDDHLIWAVTGAGKTEMLFPLIEQAILNEQRIGIVAPRVDVVIELGPRLRAAFAKIDIVILHGRSEETYHYSQVVLGTTHQLLRFQAAFDLLIIDEVDSFPFIGERMLQEASKTAVKAFGRTVYLSATPDRRTLKKNLKTSYLPLRFHGKLLPEITEKVIGNWRVAMKRKKLPRVLVNQLREYSITGRRFLLFVPKVADLLPVQTLIERYCPQMQVLSVHAKDAQRLTNVQQMRDSNVQGLITTTILERGVTFPDIDVLILGADDATFSPNALVQIAGRAGRKLSRPEGLVLAMVSVKSLRVRSAKKQIEQMNKRGEQLQ